MATFLVINSNDSGTGSLRQAILDAADDQNPDSDVIEFTPWLKDQEIVLQSTLTISSGNLTINGDMDGDGDPDLIISGDKDDSGDATSGDLDVFISVESGATLTLNSMYFAHAYNKGQDGDYTFGDGVAKAGIAGLKNAGTLNFNNSVLTDTVAKGGEGYNSSLDKTYASSGILNSGNLTINDSAITNTYALGGYGGNRANDGDGGDAGAAIFANGGSVTINRLALGYFKSLGGDGTLRTPNYAAGDGGNGYAIINTGATVSGSVSYDAAYVAVGGDGYNDGVYIGFAGGSGIFQNYDSLQQTAHKNTNTGTEKGDVLNTTAQYETVFGAAGNDIIQDTTRGGKLYGGGGNDQIFTIGPDSKAYGGAGNDIINVTLAAGGQILDGGSGIDLVDHSDDSGIDLTVNMATGAASISVWAGSLISFVERNFENFIGVDAATRTDTVTGTDGANIIAGLAGNDILKGGDGDDHLLGGADDDTLRGGNDDDVLRGDDGIDTLQGDNGNDLLFGGNDNDNLFGGNNNDKLRGGDGNDALDGGKGKDVLFGGADEDNFVFGKKYNKDTIRDFTDNVDQLTLNDNLWKGSLTKKQVLNKFATLKGNGDVVLDFGNGDILKIKGLGGINTLKNDLDIV